VLAYFETLGYICPTYMDVADFLQELPTPEGIRFISDDQETHRSAPRGTEALATAWKTSDLFKRMVAEMDAEAHNPYTNLSDTHPQTPTTLEAKDVEFGVVNGGDDGHISPQSTTATVPGGSPAVSGGKSIIPFFSSHSGLNKKEEWPKCFREPYAANHWFLFKLALQRQFKVIFRDVVFIRTR
jgi:hypothetical protein